MANVIHRTNRINGKLEQRFSVNTPAFPVGSWIINPDLSGVNSVAEIYWETVADTVVAMSQADQDVVDAAVIDDHNDDTEAAIKARLNPPLPLDGISVTIDVVGLGITVNINSVVVDDLTTVVADSTETKFVKVYYMFHSTSDSFSIEVFERTDGIYDDLAGDEQVAADFGEWSVVANGTDLVVV